MNHTLLSTPSARPAGSGLAWLLEDFVNRVPGAEGALLASRDGLKMAVHNLTETEADRMSAVMSGLFSLARGVGNIKGDNDGLVQQIVIEHDAHRLFVMSAGSVPSDGTTPAAIGELLGVLSSPEADPGVVGYGMAQLVNSVNEHLQTPVRRSTGDGQ
ncbi:roadblock/LC7 domain-containing protein [Streptomyces meridianus]|uniref:Roadblock/LC7 domain-containing protein n=1 Tax=Streptomyces meridianus TaxID=2938945 RepID=A0ABT0X3F2_9ACTN|nr:roadblock/LC7 domain-containing protein [Streptomyces meridianus]MCM2576349.1 roadblock/LC7 domain-containing protein [Streptomyces meridianus]